MTKKPQIPKGPAKPPERPSNPTTLPRPCRVVLFLDGVATRISNVCLYLFLWPWVHLYEIPGHLWRAFWRAIALVGVSYLVYDRFYETSATISASASDPTFPFSFPFAITNNSHVFIIRNLSWSCQALSLKFGDHNAMSNARVIRGSTISVEPGRTINVDCAMIGPNSRIFHTEKAHVDEAILNIELSYVVSFFGVYSKQVHPPLTQFTWIADASNPQWIKGDFIQ
jgi:hypothetical protein